MSGPRVSIVLVTKNGAATLRDVLDGIARQQCPFEFETVVVDSGSKDGTLDLLKGRVTRVLEIAPEEFNHGTTRNLGIAAARGEIVVLLVQDAIPAADDWLAKLVAPLAGEPGLAGTWARQVPRASASALTRYYLASWMGSSETPRTASLAGPEELQALRPVERLARCTFDNVCSCLRRSVWEAHPFPETDIAEDLQWARAVLLAGHRLAYAPESVVIHSHDRSARYEFLRTYLLHRELRRLFGVRLVPTGLHLVRAVVLCLAAHVRCLWHGRVTAPRQIARALALAMAFPLGQFLGPLAHDRGRGGLRVRGV